MEDPTPAADVPEVSLPPEVLVEEDPQPRIEKRPLENGEDEELAIRSAKKARRCGPGDLRRVAEIVLVLSAMAQVRGGRTPTPEEAELMVEARAKMAEMCQELAPKDIVSKEAVGSVIEDLGLNGKAKDLRLGFRGPRLTIAEKMALSKKKIEDSKKFTAHPTTYSSHPSQTNYGTAAENRGTPHPARVFSSDKQIHTPIPSGSFPASSPLGHVPATPSTSLPYQLPHEVRPPIVSSGMPSSNLGRDSSLTALPKVERGQLKVDGGSNGTPYASQVRANSSAERPLVNAPTWSVHPQSASSAKTGPDNKLPNQTPAKVEGTTDPSLGQMAPQAARDQTFRPFITQTPSGNLSNQPLPATNFVHASSYNHHNEIAKIVQKVLQPHLPEHPTWTPPSRDYMSKPLSCQLCQLTATEVETVLLCDACEKGYHLKCLQPYNQKGIPRGGEWHCPKCLQLSNGKPLPPKYGRVMRNLSSLKAPSLSAGAQSSSEKKIGTSDLKASQQKITVNGKSAQQSPAPTSAIISNRIDVPSNAKIPNARVTQGNNFSSISNDVDEKPSLVTSSNISGNQMDGEAHDAPGSSIEKSMQHIQTSESTDDGRPISDSQPQSAAESSDTVNNKTDHLQPLDNLQNVDWTALPQHVEIPAKNENSMVREPDKSPVENVDTTSVSDAKQGEIPAKNENSMVREPDKSPVENVDTTSVSDAKQGDLDVSQSESVPSKNDNSMVNDSEKSHATENVDATPICDAERDDLEILQSKSSSVASECAVSSDSLHDVNWNGDVFQVVDGKFFYKSCSIGGVMYKVQDYALFHSGHDILVPSKLQGMWEDSKTGLKWVIVKRCYFPSDLPEAVGCPPTPESNEVYESNHDSTVMAGLIQGPCEVLPAATFKEESERKNQLDTETNSGSCPVFLCKWFYDEIKGTFQPISS